MVLQSRVGDISGTIGYALAMPFRPTDLHDLDVAREVRIETTAKPGEVHSTIIWIVVDGGEVFVRSVRGERGRWYREALQNPNVRIDDSGRRLEARALPASDPQAIARVNAALERKYKGDPGYESMLKPDVLGTTLRLDPLHADEQPLEAPAYLGTDEPSELETPVEVGLLDGGPAIPEDVILQPHKPA